MKNLRIRMTRIRSGFWSAMLQLLALCGFITSCVDNSGDDPVPMYGVIPGDGSINFYGIVRSEDSLKNIPGLTVRLVANEGWDSAQTTTNHDGTYSLYYYSYSGDHLKMKVLDKDSSMNAGFFKDQTVDIVVSSRDANNGERETDILMQKK